MERERLDKEIARQCGLSRKEARQAIRRGEVTVNNRTENNPGAAIDPVGDCVAFRGQAVLFQKFLYFVMNKPKGVLCACEDRRQTTVLDLLPETVRKRGLFPVGRLDKDTTGLLILTNDGDFAHRVLSPKNEIYKTYLAELDGEVTENTVEAFRNGVMLADGTVCKKAFLAPLAGCRAEVRICEGKYHQIKRMFGTCGLGVNDLKRMAIGEFFLPETLAEGEWQEVDKKTLDSLFFAKKGLSVHNH